MRLFHPGLRHALIRPAGALAVVSVLATGVVLGAASPAAATDPAATATVISPYRQTRSVGQIATFNVTLSSGSTRLANTPITFWTRPATSSTWVHYVTKNTTSTGTSGVSFAVRVSTFVRVTFDGNEKYAKSASGSALVTAAAPFGTQVVNEASKHSGKPYQWGAVGPYRFDCSGFTLYVFGRFGKKLPHNSRQQYSVVRHVAKADMKVGDLIFIGSSPSTIGHVGIYAGNGYMWHSPKSGDVVKRSPIWSRSYYVGRVA
jgi:cell wall-associated NlpC family hydrolase